MFGIGAFSFLNKYINDDNATIQTRRLNAYFWDFVEKIGNLYEIECEAIDTKSYFILQYAFLNGTCGLAKFDYDGKYHIGIGQYTGGELDADGYPTQYTITLLNGQQKTGVIGRDIVVFKWQNTARSGISKVDWISKMLSETDSSMLFNIKWSKVCPIPIVENDTEERSLSEVITKLFSGELTIFKKKTMSLKDLGLNVEKTSDKLDLCTPNLTVYMQNYSRFREDLLKRACLELGILITTKDKGAQVNNEEINSFEDYCSISSDDTWNRLLDFKKDCKTVFDLDVNVRPKAFIYTEEDQKREQEKEEVNDDGESKDIRDDVE